MLVFSGTVLGCCTKEKYTCHVFHIRVVVDVFTEILIYSLRSSFVKGSKMGGGGGGGGGGGKHPLPPK